jgi:hypothetical protein
MHPQNATGDQGLTPYPRPLYLKLGIGYSTFNQIVIHPLFQHNSLHKSMLE